MRQMQTIQTHAAALAFTFEAVERGRHVRLTGTTFDAVAAVPELLRFPIKDHGTGDWLAAK